jgi:hypothetical protein
MERSRTRRPRSAALRPPWALAWLVASDPSALKLAAAASVQCVPVRAQCLDVLGSIEK